MHPFSAFVATAHRVETIDGVAYRLRRITMEAMAEAGVALLLVTTPAREGGGLPSSQQIRQSQDVLRRATCAAVEAVSVDGATWLPARVVLALPAGQTAEQAAAEGVIAVGDLPPTVVQRLGAAAMDHATGGRAAREWLASFPRGVADPAGPAGEALREAAE